ncbi:serine carboxypeptidase [Phanerochaete sordida]|uniref:carboxypeptidase C n=1 Tax=Phanerochaete sordida TaxID=48140 RepID=A0A9P3GHG0_9APHY|nr:serine carboxypeptidase [Phanerochaete sordida]
MELGPCKVNDAHNVTFNPYSLTENANVFFVDLPIGVGFSYADHGEYVSTSEETAKDVAAFVAIFFEHFSKFKGRAFHMASMSYGGRYIPTFASYVYDQNPRLVAAGMTPINLTSIIIQNGCTDWKTMYPAHYQQVCENRTIAPVLGISTCVEMKRALPRCEKWLKEACYHTTDPINCRAAQSFCATYIQSPFLSSGHNVYDITKPCTPEELSDTLCYPILKEIAAFLSRPSIRTALGVDAAVPSAFQMCNNAVGRRFDASLDEVFPTETYVEALLERGVRVLLYVGENDWVCNWVGNEQMTLNLEWGGADAFRGEPLREWSVHGRAVGVTRGSGELVFATVRGAGHMAPYDKGEEVLVLYQRWLAGEKL